jgi:hypothetical protein
MYAVATFLIVAVFTLVLVQFLTGALIATGLPPEVAGFQARSAFSGAGFTTTEAESVVNHPTRRKIISTGMFVGSLGTPTLVVTVMVGLMAPGPGSTTERTLVTVSGIILILLVIGARPIRRALERIGRNYANKRLIPALGTEPNELLVLGNDFFIGALRLEAEPGDTYRSLKGLRDAIPEARVLGVRTREGFLGEPPMDFTLHEDDELIIFAKRGMSTQP